MDIDTFKFVVPAGALKMETELNIGFCKEIQRGVWVKDGLINHKLETVDWDSCIEEVSFDSNPEDTILDISKCKNSSGYDISHDCKDGAMDLTKCMEGRTCKIPYKHRLTQHNTFITHIVFNAFCYRIHSHNFLSPLLSE